jgi:ferrous iron transport protein A
MIVERRIMIKKDLTMVESGKSFVVKEIAGGIGSKKRLEAFGIVPGVVLKKLSSQIMRGPVVLSIKNTQVAIGYGMAKKIIVEEIENGEG